MITRRDICIRYLELNYRATYSILRVPASMRSTVNRKLRARGKPSNNIVDMHMCRERERESERAVECIFRFLASNKPTPRSWKHVFPDRDFRNLSTVLNICTLSDMNDSGALDRSEISLHFDCCRQLLPCKRYVIFLYLECILCVRVFE